VLTHPEVVYVPVPAYKPLPPQLTDPLPEPPPPPRLCSDAKGKRAVCALDGLAATEGWKAMHKLANHDRARAALLGKSDGTQ
jgi:hypothetical protein